MLEREAMAVLVSVPGVSYGRRELALRESGGALAILNHPDDFALQLGQQGAAAVKQMMREGGAETMLARLSRMGIRLVVRGEAGYPARLLQIPNPPHLLFCCGSADLDEEKAVGVVGTRRASEYGLRHARQISRGLAEAGVCVVSGLALGVDSAGHRGALDGRGKTIAVLGGALDKFYPAENRAIAREIVDCGGSVISEYPLGFAPTKYTFLHRNRIIAGMTQGVVVVEGAKRSGALRTAQDALDFGREVFALPGSVENVGSQLPHMLISEGAHLVICARDVLEHLHVAPAAEEREEKPEKPRKPAKKRAKKAPSAAAQPASDATKAETAKKPGAVPEGLGPEETAVYRALMDGERDFDELAEATGIPSDDLGAILMMMDMDGWVRALPGTRYALCVVDE